MKKRTFTLIELLVVIAILSILFTMLLPAMSGAKSTAKRIKCSSNLKNIGTAFELYASDNSSRWPYPQSPGGGWYWNAPYLWEYTGPVYWNLGWTTGSKALRESIWACPELLQLTSNVWQCAGYGMNSSLPPGTGGVNKSPEAFKIRYPSRTILAGDSRGFYSPSSGNWNLGTACGTWDVTNLFGYVHVSQANMLHADGHVMSGTKQTFLQLGAQSPYIKEGSY